MIGKNTGVEHKHRAIANREENKGVFTYTLSRCRAEMLLPETIRPKNISCKQEPNQTKKNADLSGQGGKIHNSYMESKL